MMIIINLRIKKISKFNNNIMINFNGIKYLLHKNNKKLMFKNNSNLNNVI